MGLGGGGQIIQVDTLPTASADLVGTVYQYIGNDTLELHSNYFYKCSEDTSTTPSTYRWVNVEVQNGTISRELHQYEYDALTDAEKSDGTVYYVDDAIPITQNNTVMGFTPVGTVISVMGNHAPEHYLACNGQIVDIADYPELAEYFKREFGVANYFGGNGTTTFKIPDLRGEFLRGSGTNSHGDNGSGAAVGIHQDSTGINPGWANNSSGGWSFKFASTGTYNNIIVDTSEGYHSLGARASYIANVALKTIGNTDSECGYAYVRPTNTSVLWCIATKDIFLSAEVFYSADEKVVGQWVDGSPIYQKTIDIGALPNNTTKDVSHDISNLKVIISIDGYATDTSSNKSNCTPLPYSAVTSSDSIAVWEYEGNLKIRTGINYSAYSGYVTLKYTKTTD